MPPQLIVIISALYLVSASLIAFPMEREALFEKNKDEEKTKIQVERERQVNKNSSALEEERAPLTGFSEAEQDHAALNDNEAEEQKLSSSPPYKTMSNINESGEASSYQYHFPPK